MICPRCGERNDLGVQRCEHCRQPFTREATIRQARREGYEPTAYPVPVEGRDDWLGEPSDPAGYVPAARARRGRRRTRRPGCMIALGSFAAMLFVIVVAALIVSNWYIKPMVKDMAVSDLRDGVQSEVATQIEAQLADAPEGEVVITEAEINDRIDATGNLGPIDTVDVEITPTGLEVALSAYGLSGDYDAQLIEQDGAVALEGGSLGGPLSFVVPDGDLASAVNAEIAAAIAASGYRVDSVALGDGTMTLVLVR